MNALTHKLSVFVLLLLALPGCDVADKRVSPATQPSSPRPPSTVPARPPDSGGPSEKRVGPPPVAPVGIGNLRFEAIHWGKERGLGQNGGYIAARDRTSGKEIWTLKIYDIAYDPALESDVQDVFIQSMSRIGGDKLQVIDEKDRRYIVDPQARSVTQQK